MDSFLQQIPIEHALCGRHVLGAVDILIVMKEADLDPCTCGVYILARGDKQTQIRKFR